MTLSICLIVKDEELTLKRCLNSIKNFCDEIIVVDTGSIDKTVLIAKSFTQKVYHFKWCDDFAKARNYSLSKATCDYIMWLDADDVVEESEGVKIKELLKNADFDMAFLKYVMANEDGERNFVFYRERIFKREKNYKFEGFVHEAIVPKGKLIYSDAKIIHSKLKQGDPIRNLTLYQKNIIKGHKLSPREQFYYGRELTFLKMYSEAIAVLEDFLQTDGWVENKIEALLNLHSIYSFLNQSEKAYNCILKTFLLGPPRSQACCILGDYFLLKNQLSTAEYWYNCALKNNGEDVKGGFINTDYNDYIPLLGLCVVYDRLGNYFLANEYNEKAGAVKPNSLIVKKNKEYFKNKI